MQANSWQIPSYFGTKIMSSYSNLLKKTNSQIGQKPLSIKEKIINQDNKQTTKEKYWGKNKKGIDPEVNKKENRKKRKKNVSCTAFHACACVTLNRRSIQLAFTDFTCLESKN